jgi:D-tyrosyl-tRNA(Tyr) deacylase
MRVVVQRSEAASVVVDGKTVGKIEGGLVLLVGVKAGDSDQDVTYMADKIAYLRVFEDDDGKMNDDVRSKGGAILSISQFTLYGDVRKGRRPNYMDAARPEEALARYEQLNDALRGYGLRVETGQFGTMMQVHMVNSGPVTILLDSERKF